MDLLQVDPQFSVSFLLSIPTTIFAVCVMRQIVQWLLHFVTVGFLFKGIMVTSVKSVGHSQVSYMLLISCVISPRPSSPVSSSTSPCTSSSPVGFLSFISLIDFSTYFEKCKGLSHLHLLPLQV